MDLETAPTAGDIPPWIRRSGAVAWRLLAVALATYVVAVFLEALTLIVVPIALALVIASLLEPVARRASGTRLPDWVAPLASVLVVMVLIVGVVLAVGARIARHLPELRADFRQSVQQIEQQFSVQLPALPGDDQSSSSDRSASSGQSSSTGSGSSDGGGTSAAKRVLSVGSEVLLGFFLTFALAFLFLKDGARMWAWLLSKFGDGARDDVDAAGRAAWGTLAPYFRGLTLVALFDAVGIGLGLLVLGVPLVLTLAVLQFVASYVPTIGALVAGGVAVIVAFGSGGLVTAGIVVVIAVAVQQIGNDVIEPWVMGATLPLHPAVVLIAVSAGAVLWGIAGALLFVPLAAAVSAAGHVLWERHRSGASAAQSG